MQIDDSKHLLLQKNNLFNSLPLSIINDIAQKLSIVSFQLGDTVINAGEPGQAFYIIACGKARVLDYTNDNKPITLAVLTQEDWFGEQPLLFQQPAQASVRAAEDLTLLKLTNADFYWLVKNFPNFRKELEVGIKQQTDFQFLRSLKCFSNLSLSETQKLFQAIETIYLQQDEFLFHESDMAESAYIIRAGNIRLIKESAENTTLAILKTSDLFCEDTSVHSLSLSTGAVATENTVIWRFSQEVLRQLTSNPKVYEHITQLAKNRSLQQQAVLANRSSFYKTYESAPTLQSKRVKVGKGWFAPHYTFVQVETPMLAGIACLDMINRFYQRKIDLQPTIKRQLLAGNPDTPITISRKAEAQRYLTRFLYLNDERLSMATFPAIVENNEGQLCVILSVSRTHVTLANPLTEIYKIPRQQFVQSWNGNLLTISYVPNFGNIGNQTTKIIQQFWLIVRPYSILLIWIGITSLILQLLGLVRPLFSQIMIDKALAYGNYSLLYLMLLGMLFVTTAQLASNVLREVLLTHVLKRLSVSFIIRFFNHILSLPPKILSKWRVGDLNLRFQENENFLHLISQSFFKIIIDSITILFYLIILLNQNAKLTGVALVFIAAYGLILVIFTPLLRANDRQVFEGRQEVQSHLIETINGIETIKSIATESLFFQQGNSLVAKAQKFEFQGAVLAFNIGLVSNLINKLSVIVILGYGAKLTIDGKLSIGELVAFNLMLGLLLNSLQGLISVWDELQQIRISLERLNDVLVLPPEYQDPTAVMPQISGYVNLKNVCFRYDESEHSVLHSLNLEVLPGQKIAIVGRSGSGKTTLAKLLGRLLQPTSGSILINNIDISNIEPSSYRRQLGIVEQHPFLFNGTIRENIAKADLNANLESVVAAAKLAGAHEFIQKLPMDYDTQIGERGITLSGGQRQLLVIARALLTNPRILILDEPTASLDSESERIIQQNLEQQMAGRTAFIFAHRLSTVQTADLILVLEQGKIVESGTHKQLLAQGGLYSYLYTK